jgi:hypothetical protein
MTNSALLPVIRNSRVVAAELWRQSTRFQYIDFAQRTAAHTSLGSGADAPLGASRVRRNHPFTPRNPAAAFTKSYRNSCQ